MRGIAHFTSAMILPKATRLTPEQLTEVTGIVTEFGCKIQQIVGAVRTIYAIVGDEREELMINRLEGLDYVDRIDRIQSPFKLMDKRSDLASHRITIGGVTLGEELFGLFASLRGHRSVARCSHG